MEPIAIIGFAFRLPQGAEDPVSLWGILEKGQNVMTEWPTSRTNINAYYEDNSERKNILKSKGGHFLQGNLGAFEAPFFAVTTKEASSIDPQQRILMETTYRALENAGIPLEKVAGSATGVFAGSMTDDYIKIMSKDPDEAPTNAAIGVSMSMLANRLSWYFDLRGPSLTVNTACSSSITALDLACQSLRGGQSAMALVTGSNLLLSPEISLHLTNMNFLSPDSVCYSFDDRANGYGRGEGVIVLVLKKLTDAVKSGDVIRAVIRGIGSNQDGHTPGITQPSALSQEELIRAVYKRCDLGLESTRYVEAHGTGTQLGDATEAKALGQVFRSLRSQADPLYIGSIKSNFGHLEGASGLAAILKATLILEKGVIPPNALFRKWNPRINAEGFNLRVAKSCTRWPFDGLRRISVNSFGFGGSNGHVILDDAYHALKSFGIRGYHRTVTNCSIEEELGPPSQPYNITMLSQQGLNAACQVTKEAERDYLCGANGVLDVALPARGERMVTAAVSDFGKSLPYKLLIWSAKDKRALTRILEQYAVYLKKHSTSNQVLDKLAYTLALRRSTLEWRTFAVACVNENCTNLLSPQLPPLVRSAVGRGAGVTFVFTGQGAQYPCMGMELLRYPKFRSTLLKASEIFRELGADWDLLDKMRQPEAQINEACFSQPLCTALQLALVDLLKSFGIVPAAVIGHSSGEIAAAYTVGALSFTSACKVAYHRGRLASLISCPGSMVSVNLAENEVQSYMRKVLGSLAGGVHVACINSPLNVTLSGNPEALEVLRRQLNSEGVFAQTLKTGIAYHSPAMEEIATDYHSCLGVLTRNDEDLDHKVVMVSTVTGDRISHAQLSQCGYWVNNLVSPVRFTDALEYLELAAPRIDGFQPVSAYLEIGPHSALRRSVSDTVKLIGVKDRHPEFLSVLSRHESPLKTIMSVAGHIFALGHPVSVQDVNQCTESSRQALVDLPEYPFDHSRSYWHESRVSREWRLREFGARSLLGSRATDYNALQPQWRKILSTQDTTWIAHHVVGKVPYFPAAGTLMMALEAVRQVASPTNGHQLISGYFIKEALFSSPITLEPENRVEVLTYLRPLQQAHEKTSSRFEIRIVAHVDGYWNECFKAIIITQYQFPLDTQAEVDGGREAKARTQAIRREYKQSKVSCTKSVGKQAFYKWQHEHGLKYGESFSLLQNIMWDGANQAMAEINKKSNAPFDSIVHPAILDSLFQVCSVSPSRGMTNSFPTCIPHKIRDAWISATGWQDQVPNAGTIRVWARSKLRIGTPGVESSIASLSADGEPLCRIGRIEMAPIAAPGENKREKERSLFSRVEWKPKLSTLPLSQLSLYRNPIGNEPHTTGYDNQNPVKPADDHTTRLVSTLRDTLALYLTQLQETGEMMVPSHIERYLSWAKEQLGKASFDQLPCKHAIFAELEALQNQRPSWRYIFEVAKHLVSIVTGQLDASSILLSPSSSSSDDFWSDAWHTALIPELDNFLELSAHETPAQKVLHLSAGNWGLASHITSILKRIDDHTGGLSYSSYVFGNTSIRFLEHAQRQFRERGEIDRITTLLLDGSKEISHHLGNPGTYDNVFVEQSFLLAVGDMACAIQAIKSALKPGGHLIVVHALNSEGLRFIQDFSLGVLQGWWLGQGADTQHPHHSLSTAEWDNLLRKNGFLRREVILGDSKAGCHIEISIAGPEGHENGVVPISGVAYPLLVVVDDQDKESDNLPSMLTANGALAQQIKILTISQIEWQTEAKLDIDVMFLADMHGTMLADLSSTLYASVKNLIQASRNLLWVSSNDTCALQTPPYHALKDGLLRTLRNEMRTKRIVSLSLENIHTLHEKVENIARVWDIAFGAVQTPESEYLVRNGVLHTGRLTQMTTLDDEIIGREKRVKNEAYSSGPPLKLTIQTPGLLETLRFVQDTTYHGTSLGPTEIEIEAKVWGLNFREVFMALGRLPGEMQDGLGSDCAGIVTRVGPECSGAIRPGDRVYMLAIGCMRTYPRSDECAVVCIPDSLSFSEACAVISPSMTAWRSLAEVARLQEGEKVLIHTAAGATGQVALQVAKLLKAEIYATVGYNYKKQLLLDLYGNDGTIVEDRIFYSRDSSFAEGVARLTDGYGVDVVLNSLMGDGLLHSWECLAPYGRFVEIGKADIHANSNLPMGQFARNVSFSAVDLRDTMISRPAIGRKLLHDVVELVGQGKLKAPRPIHTYRLSAIEEAFRYFQSGKNTGRVIIEIDPREEVQKYLAPTRRTWRFDPGAGYLIVGGLGGIGRSILKWMGHQGAKHLIVPSRSGPVLTASGKQVVGELTRKGVTVVTPKCDVADPGALSRVLSECLVPIKGCINAAMVLNDSVFENMTHTQWQESVRAKVATSWNLHHLLPKDMDFFILLSSVSGVIGNPGQANYAAGCTFQDALARHRRQNGQKAISIDLGVVDDVGIVAETHNIQEKLAGGLRNLVRIKEKDILSTLAAYCDPTNAPSDSSHVIMGLGNPEDFAAQDLDAPHFMQLPLFDHFNARMRCTSDKATAIYQVNYASLFRKAETAEAKATIVLESLAQKLARALSIEAEDVDHHQPLHAFGVDSLVAVELQNWLAVEFGADVAVYELMGGRSIGAISNLITSKANKIS